MCMRKRWVKSGLTVLGAIFFSTLGIFASDRLQGIDGDIQNIAGVRGSTACDKNSVPMSGKNGIICVDMYEASPSKECPVGQPAAILHSEKNVNTQGCVAVSEHGTTPWNNISLPQAQRACAAAGKRLPTNDEWYAIVLGTHPESCIVNKEGVAPTGTEACKSSIGAFDVVGNVWEWVDATVNGYSFNNRTLPSEGYITSVDADGIAITSGTSTDELYGKDYIWTKSDGVFGMIRGGFYGSGEDAGLYTVNASVATSFASQGIGFRCVEDVL